MTGAWSMKLMKEEQNRENAEQKGMVSTESDDLEQMPPWMQSVRTKKPVTEELRTFMKNVVQDTLARSIEALGRVSEGENFRIKKSEQVKIERVRSPEEGSSYLVQKRKLEKMRLEEQVPSISMAQ